MNKDQIKHIADIAQIDFTSEELDKFEMHFNETMQLIEKIKEIDTGDVEAVFQVNGTQNNLRKDEVSSSLSQEDALKNTAKEKYGYFELLRFVD